MMKLFKSDFATGVVVVHFLTVFCAILLSHAKCGASFQSKHLRIQRSFFNFFSYSGLQLYLLIIGMF